MAQPLAITVMGSGGPGVLPGSDTRPRPRRRATAADGVKLASLGITLEVELVIGRSRARAAGDTEWRAWP